MAWLEAVNGYLKKNEAGVFVFFSGWGGGVLS